MPQLPLEFNCHAKNRIRWDNISEDDVQAILDEPFAITPMERAGLSNAWGRSW